MFTTEGSLAPYSSSTEQSPENDIDYVATKHHRSLWSINVQYCFHNSPKLEINYNSVLCTWTLICGEAIIEYFVRQNFETHHCVLLSFFFSGTVVIQSG